MTKAADAAAADRYTWVQAGLAPASWLEVCLTTGRWLSELPGSSPLFLRHAACGWGSKGTREASQARPSHRPSTVSGSLGNRARSGVSFSCGGRMRWDGSVRVGEIDAK